MESCSLRRGVGRCRTNPTPPPQRFPPFPVHKPQPGSQVIDPSYFLCCGAAVLLGQQISLNRQKATDPSKALANRLDSSGAVGSADQAANVTESAFQQVLHDSVADEAGRAGHQDRG